MFDYASDFDQSLDSWNVTSATNMNLMFFGTSLRQDLCPWGSQLAARSEPAPLMTMMFYQNTGCLNTNDPDTSTEPWTPFCFDC